MSDEYTPISEAKKMRNDINVKATVKSKGTEREVTLRSGDKARVCDVIISDDSDQIKLALWGKEIDKVTVGDTVVVKNGYTNEFRGEISLNKKKGRDANHKPLVTFFTIFQIHQQDDGAGYCNYDPHDKQDARYQKECEHVYDGGNHIWGRLGSGRICREYCNQCDITCAQIIDHKVQRPLPWHVQHFNQVRPVLNECSISITKQIIDRHGYLVAGLVIDDVYTPQNWDVRGIHRIGEVCRVARRDSGLGRDLVVQSFKQRLYEWAISGIKGGRNHNRHDQNGGGYNYCSGYSYDRSTFSHLKSIPNTSHQK